MSKSMFKVSLVAALLLGACGYSSPYMRVIEPPRALTAPADAALVVFIRPSGFANGVGATILDGDGRFVGDSASESHFSVKVTPGRHLFVVWAENTDTVELEAAAGRTYFIEVGATMGVWTAQMNLLALTPSSKQWGKREEWMANTRQMRPDRAAGQEMLSSRSRDVEERLRRARERIEKYRRSGNGAHFIAVDDGV